MSSKNHDAEIYVRAHYRKRPGPPKPHWIVYDPNQQQFFNGLDGADVPRWVSDIASAPSFLKRSLNVVFGQDFEAGTLVPLKVD